MVDRILNKSLQKQSLGGALKGALKNFSKLTGKQL